jgi:hypothetical protein
VQQRPKALVSKVAGFMNIIAFLLSAIVGLAPKGALPQVIGADEHADIYSIYSLMMTNPQTSHGPSTDDVYLIAEMTRPAVPAEPCVRVPPQYEMAYQEVLDEYNRRKDKPVKLERALNIVKRYELLNADDVSEYVAIHSGYLRPPSPNPQEVLRKSTDLFYLGDVYFDKSHRLALTAISTYCGGLCGQWLWKVFEKSSTGQWESRPWVGCSAIARIEHRRSHGARPQLVKHV